MARELYFVIRRDGNFERIHHVAVTETTIGRVQDCGLCLPDAAVSRRHALLLRAGTGFVIRDLKSRNGTLVNGRPIAEEVLSLSALVQIGPYRLKSFDDLASAEADGCDESTREAKMSRTASGEVESRERLLTAAQRRVYSELMHGRSEKEIAAALRISINTVHTHSRAIYTVFRVSSRAELLSWCLDRLTQHDF